MGFLPADIGAWEDDKKGVANAIVDTEFRAWLKAIRAKGTSLVVVDTCDSGTMIRGTETVREVMMEELKIPVKVMNDARNQAEKLAAKYPDKLGPGHRRPFANGSADRR